MKASEEERFRDLAAASLPWLTRTATALTGDPHRGDDLVQEALVKAYVHWRKVRSADNPPAYLRRILVRCHLDAARAANRRETPSGHQPTQHDQRRPASRAGLNGSRNETSTTTGDVPWEEMERVVTDPRLRW